MVYRLARTVGLALLVGSLLLTACGGDDAASNADVASDRTAAQAEPETRPSTTPTTPESIPASTTEKTAAAPSKGDAVGIAAIDSFITEQAIDKSASDWKTSLPKPPQAEFGDETIYWNLATNVGNIKVRLLPEVAPMHVSSTIYLTNLGFYDDVIFHRVITGFMAQGGDPLGKGFGGPGYKYDGEFSPSVRHDKPGLLSMANSGPGTDGSQFFLTFVPTPHLDGKHTIFGEVVDGTDTVRTLEAAGSRNGRPTERLVIEQATITTE
jgi:cyclophilin family peptidyl-prolyl cis-trans isomerase